MTPAQNVLSREELIGVVALARSAGSRTFGERLFDVLHVGHIRYLQGRELGDVLSSRRSASGLQFKKAPVARYSQPSNAPLLAALESVSYITIFDEPTVEGVLALKPDVHARRNNYTI
jgi:bifunctional ADP-heptose synthase (sugar kinase/adenylyltransferase)